MYISTPPSPEVENFQIEIYYPAGDRTPDLLEPEADVLPSEPARRLINKLWIVESPTVRSLVNLQMGKRSLKTTVLAFRYEDNLITLCAIWFTACHNIHRRVKADILKNRYHYNMIRDYDIFHLHSDKWNIKVCDRKMKLCRAGHARIRSAAPIPVDARLWTAISRRGLLALPLKGSSIVLGHWNNILRATRTPET